MIRHARSSRSAHTSRRALAAALAAIGLVALAASPVLAEDGPVIVRRTIDQTRLDTRTCPFTITVHTTGLLDDALFFDADGHLVRVHETVVQLQTTYTANGKTLISIGTGGFDIYFNADGSRTLSTYGINELLVLPGQGPSFLDTGHAVFVIDATGFHVEFHAGPAEYDIAAFCAALA